MANKPLNNWAWSSNHSEKGSEKIKKKNILISFPLSFSYNIIFSLVHVRKHCKPFKLKEFANEAQEIYIDVNKALIR